MITLQLPAVPVPDRVADLIGQQIPERVLQAEVEAVNQAYNISLCRSPRYAEAREYALGDLARANKILAAFDPRFIVRAGGAA
ncbi:hypothetical protein EAO71_27360 [Streptomyces sp. ms191]|uniref:hypothetical protein n=1 Tax=Streptomyces sp. ms191 TaxID=1827978 RepID=UPI0011CDDC9D|nr:hypothetical protein [Streptomyces sp. ms191]TXS21421.1 hypothetical protein EAO71_27360 [Streptomyces sp. ms191]